VGLHRVTVAQLLSIESRIDSRKDVHGRWTSLKTYSLLILSAARKDKQELVHQDGTSVPGTAAPVKYPGAAVLCIPDYASCFSPCCG